MTTPTPAPEAPADPTPLFDTANPYMGNVCWQIPWMWTVGTIPTPAGTRTVITFRTGGVTMPVAMSADTAREIAAALVEHAGSPLLVPTPGLIVPGR